MLLNRQNQTVTVPCRNHKQTTPKVLTKALQTAFFFCVCFYSSQEISIMSGKDFKKKEKKKKEENALNFLKP